MLTSNEVQTIAATYSSDENEIDGFVTLWRFLSENTYYFFWRGTAQPNLHEQTGANELAKRYFKYKFAKVSLSTPQTVPDEMVSVVLKRFYNHSLEKIKTIKIEHQQSMAAENMIGELLERYIDSISSKIGWVWCCGSLVRHVDFIKPETSGYRLLQIKNRNNSENSSSKAIRDNTSIEHWFRTYARTGKTNWGNFPDTSLRSSLSEAGFISFIENYK